jgi:hypothetical protein
MKRQLAGILFFAAVTLYGADLPAGVPKGSTDVGQGRYRFVDKDNKAWIYRMTPFGFQRSPEDSVRTDGAEKASATADEQPKSAGESNAPRTDTPFGKSSEPASGMPATKVTEQGDSIRFERQSPFGVYRWTRKKSELTAEERRLWEQQRNASATANKQ